MTLTLAVMVFWTPGHAEAASISISVNGSAVLGANTGVTATSTTTANFTLTGSGNLSGPNLGTSAVPEPASLPLLGLGIAAAGGLARNQAQAR